MAHAAFKKQPAYAVPQKPRRIMIRKPELAGPSFSLQSHSSGDSVGIFYKALLVLSAGCSFVSLWLAFQA